MKNTLLTIPLFIAFIGLNPAQNNGKAQIEKFLSIIAAKDFKDKKKEIEALIIPLKSKTGSLTSKRREFFYLLVDSYHQDLQDKDIKKLVMISYKDLPKEEQNILTETEPKDSIYIVKYNKKYLFTISMKGNLIKSLSVMSKGSQGKKIIVNI
ncbi:hypothetical protein [Pedobacter steynii]|uniref:Uncharacterized protein n=1 Tax=Pedobacter steynii TaxID=430522 RepID=A0A1D7QFD2_9SPHI|nr:hypothetical protein [Pedobacter steynii]AOM77370.1 hypothetical protein BFS30_09455 [Pedobacter steynii]